MQGSTSKGSFLYSSFSRRRQSHTVQCDERRPICGQCTNRGTDCTFKLSVTSTGSSHRANAQTNTAMNEDSNGPHATTSELSLEACLGLHVFATSISRAVKQRSAAGLSNNSLAYILQHFERTGYTTCSSPVGQRILHDKIPQMLMAYPFLLHTVLAFSSSHLGYVSRDTPTHGTMVLTAGYHTQRALRLYSEQIRLHQRDRDHTRMQVPTGLDEMDALFASCILLTSLFYHVGESNLPHRSWAVSTPDPASSDGQNEPGIDWLTNTSGLTILLSLTQFQTRLGSSVWLPFISEASRLHGTPTAFKTSSSGSSSTTPSTAATSSTTSTSSAVPMHDTPSQAIHDFYQKPLTPPATSSANLPNTPPHLLRLALAAPNMGIYGPALTLLDPLLALDPTDLSYFGAFISWPSRLSSDFIALLRRKEQPPALSYGDGLYACSGMRAANLAHSTCDHGAMTDFAVPGASSSLPVRRPDPDPVALLILGYWFDRIGEVPHWWCGRRGRGESVAILGWLKSLTAGGGCASKHDENSRKMFVRAVEEFERKTQGKGIE